MVFSPLIAGTVCSSLIAGMVCSSLIAGTVCSSLIAGDGVLLIDCILVIDLQIMSKTFSLGMMSQEICSDKFWKQRGSLSLIGCFMKYLSLLLRSWNNVASVINGVYECALCICWCIKSLLTKEDEEDSEEDSEKDWEESWKDWWCSITKKNQETEVWEIEQQHLQREPQLLQTLRYLRL